MMDAVEAEDTKIMPQLRQILGNGWEMDPKALSS